MQVIKLWSINGNGFYYSLIDNQNNEITPVNDFIRFLKVKNYSSNTLKNYTYDLKRYFEYLNITSQEYHDIKTTYLVDFLNYLTSNRSPYPTNKINSKNLSQSTIRRILAAISSFYDWLAILELSFDHKLPNKVVINTTKYPVSQSYKSFLSFAKKNHFSSSRLIRIKTPKSLPKSIKKEDLILLLNSLKSLRDKAIIFLALQGGMRIGEILGLCFEDINFRKKEIIVRYRANNPNGACLKGMRERILFIEEPEALNMLNDYILHERPSIDIPYILLAAKGKSYGKPLTYQGIYTVIEHHCKKLNISKKFTLHMLRHTHATNLYEKGMSLLSLQKRLGHASPQTTQIYAYVSDNQLKMEYLSAINNTKDQ